MSGRLHQIDFLRGFCLLNIFVNHITIGVLQQASPSKILPFDSADCFVFLAGISVALAFGPAEGRAIDTLRIWRRSWYLYKANLVVAAGSILILVAGAAAASMPMIATHPVDLIAEHGLRTYLLHVVTMQQSVGYSMVLRLYVLLLLTAPLYLWLAQKRYWYPLLVAMPLWLLAGLLGLVESDVLSGTPLRLTFLPWNLVFAAGIVLGTAITNRQSLPASRGLDMLAIGLAIVLPVFFVVAEKLDPAILHWLVTRDERFLTGVSKTLQSPLRVAALIGSAYLLIRLAKAPVIRLLHEIGPTNPLCRLGRASLPVFVLGAILALAVEQVLAIGHFRYGVTLGTLPAFGLEILLVSAGFLAMLRVASEGSSRMLGRSTA